MSRASICYEDLAVEVEIDDPSIWVWLGEFLGPSFEVARRKATEGLVRLCTDEEKHRSLGLLLRSHETEQRPFFALDSKVLHYPVWKCGAERVAHDDKYDCYYSITESAIEVVARADSRRGRFALMRVVRELIAQRAARAAGRVQLHAACVAVNGRAVALAGPKATGKTTLLIGALQTPGAAYVSNDRLYATVRDGGIEVRGVPTSVSVRPRTLDFHTRLARALPDVRSVSHLTLEEAKAELAASGPRDPGRRVTLSPALLTSTLGVESLPSAPLHSLVFLLQAEAAEPPSLEVVQRDEARARLISCLFGVDTPSRPLTELERWAGFEKPAAPPPDATLHELVSRVQCFRHRMGYGAESAMRGAEGFLRRVL